MTTAQTPKRHHVIIVLFAWMALILTGFGILMKEEFAASPRIAPIAFFPAKSRLSLDPHRSTLLLFVHPQCPCTEATFEELGQLRAETNQGMAVTIVFVCPPGVPAGWEKGELWTEANRMPGVHMDRDENGTETRLFGVTGSGHALVYTPTGRLLFSGGITPSRGHGGDSPGRSAIVALLRDEWTPHIVEMPVFGCALL